MWGFSFDDHIVERARDADKLADFKKAFMSHYDSKDLKQASQFSIDSNLILQVFFKYEPFMSNCQKERFRKYLESYLDSATEEVEIVNLDSSTSGTTGFTKYLKVRLEVSAFKLFELFSEISCRTDMSEYFDDPLFG